MQVYCRFSPLAPTGKRKGASVKAEQDVLDIPVLLRVADCVQPPAADTGDTLEELTMVDPITSSTATFACTGIFLPRTGITAAAASSPSSYSGVAASGTEVPAGAAVVAGRARTRAAQWESEQQEVYETIRRTCWASATAVTAEGRHGAPPPPPASATREDLRGRSVLLAYGQTSAGKTHTLFGPCATPPPGRRTTRASWARQLRAPTAGVVPRYLVDLFSSTTERVGTAAAAAQAQAIAYVDVSCFEIYNEATTDLIGWAVSPEYAGEQCRGGEEDPLRPVPPPLGHSRQQTKMASTSSLCSTSFSNDNCALMAMSSSSTAAAAATRLDAGEADQEMESEGDEVFSSVVANSFRRYLHDTLADAASAAAAGSSASPPAMQVHFKSTERARVLHRLHKLRCVSAEEAWAAIRHLLELRRRSATERNASSSRGHLLLRIEAYTHLQECNSDAVFADLAGSESGKAVPTAAAAAAAATQEALCSAAAEGSRAGPATRFSRSHSNLSTSSRGGMSNMSTIQSDRSSNSSSSSSAGVKSRKQLTAAQQRARREVLLHPERAGMEATARAQNRTAEMRNINTSLLALRKVVHAFRAVSRHGGKDRRGAAAVIGAHAPFRDSTLTVVLEPFLFPAVRAALSEVSISGNSTTDVSAGLSPRIALVVCCSSREADFHESVSSLRLGAEASDVKPSVVLQALPQYQQRRRQEEDHRASQRSVSLPSRLVTGTGKETVTDTLHHHSISSHGCKDAADGSCVDDNTHPCHDAARQQGHTRRDDKEREERDRIEREQLQSDARRYRELAEQLFKQCRALCADYDAAVRDLTACRTALSAKNTCIAQLQAALALSGGSTATCVPSARAQQHGVEDATLCLPAGSGRPLYSSSFGPAAAAAADSLARAEGGIQSPSTALRGVEVSPWTGRNTMELSSSTKSAHSTPREELVIEDGEGVNKEEVDGETETAIDDVAANSFVSRGQMRASAAERMGSSSVLSSFLERQVLMRREANIIGAGGSSSGNPPTVTATTASSSSPSAAATVPVAAPSRVYRL